MAYDISKAIYSNTTLNDVSLNALTFNDDGTKMYVARWNQGEVREYDLSIDWCVGSASFVQLFDTSVEETNIYGVCFNATGTKMYVAGNTTGTVSEYDLGVAWDISSSVHLQSLSVSSEINYVMGMTFSTDGTRMYLLGNLNFSPDEVYEYTLSSAWNISTASLTRTNSSLSDISSFTGISFRPDGKRMYVSLFFVFTCNVREFALETAWDISTISLLYSHDNLSEPGSSAGDIELDDVGDTLYISKVDSNEIYEYSLTNSKTRPRMSCYVPPTPTSVTHGWFGGGTVGSSRVNNIDRIIFASDTVNAVDRCNLTLSRCYLASFADSTYCWFGGGAVWYGPPSFDDETNVVDRITLSNDTGNAIDRCNLSVAKHTLKGFANDTYGWFGGGYPVPNHTKVDRITLANDTANAIYRCDMSITSYSTITDLTHGWFCGSSIERITLSDDTTNAINRCSVSVTRWEFAAITNYVYGWFGGGYTYTPATVYNIVDRITIANDTVNAIDRCDLFMARSHLSAVTDATYGWFAGGYNVVSQTNMIDRITLSNDTVNAVDRCDLSLARYGSVGSVGNI